MPRITAKKKDYMVADLSKWIAGQMYLLGLKQGLGVFLRHLSEWCEKSLSD